MNISSVIDISRHLLHPDCSVSGDCVIRSLSWTVNHEFSYCSRSLRPSLLAFTEFFCRWTQGLDLKLSIIFPASDQTDWCANSPVMKRGSTELKLVLKNKANRWVSFTGVPSKKENTRARTGMWSGLFYGHSAARLIRIPPGFLFTVQDVQKGHRGAFVRNIDAFEKLQSAQTVCHILE